MMQTLSQCLHLIEELQHQPLRGFEVCNIEPRLSLKTAEHEELGVSR